MTFGRLVFTMTVVGLLHVGVFEVNVRASTGTGILGIYLARRDAAPVAAAVVAPVAPKSSGSTFFDWTDGLPVPLSRQK
mgnify:CR=1 FL=1